MNPILRHALATAGILMVFTAVGTFLLTGTFQQTKEPIAKSEREARRNLLGQVMPASMHDNDLLQDAIELPPAELLGQQGKSLAYRAHAKGQPTGVVLEAIAHDGYSGDIKLLIGISTSGALTGVRVLAHKETPGLGDYIELEHGDWIKNFDGKSLAQEDAESPPPGALSAEQWRVKKDGGDFDYMAGATITPRAVVKAVHKALMYFHQSRDTIFASGAQTPQTQTEKEHT